MIGLFFLFAVGAWLAASLFITRGIFRLVHPRSLAYVVAAPVGALMLGAPLVDELVGMRQFHKLCSERAVARVSPNAKDVTRARSITLPTTHLRGYWIDIQSQPVRYVDADSGEAFFTYEGLHTKGGRIVGIMLMGGSHSCWPKDSDALSKQLNLDRLLKQQKVLGEAISYGRSCGHFLAVGHFTSKSCPVRFGGAVALAKEVFTKAGD